MVGFEKITAPFPAVEINSFRNNRAVGELNQQLFDRFVRDLRVKILIKIFFFAFAERVL
jgi:hypothetical protein